MGRWSDEYNDSEETSDGYEGNSIHEIGIDALESRALDNLRKTNPFKEINNHEFYWLKRKENERAVFWCWLFLISESEIINNQPGNMHRKLYVSKHLFNFKDRSNAVISFYQDVSLTCSHELARQIYNRMISEWSEFISVVKRVRWIESKSEDELVLIKDRLVKMPEFNNGVLSWFSPIDRSEFVRLIVGAIDEVKLSAGNSYSRTDIHYKNMLLHDMRMAYEQRKRRLKLNESGKRTAINAEVSTDVKNKLITMSKDNGMQINKFLEKIISEEFERYKNKL